MSEPILAFPDCSKPFVLDTDASDSGVGAVLSQVQDDGTERIIAYASRALSKPERQYCVTRRELLAVVYFIQHFRPYLFSNQFTLRTDHGSLKWLRNFKQPEGQLDQWFEKLQEYNFSIEHHHGRKHNNADALSRLPCRQCGRESHYESDSTITISIAAVDGQPHHLPGQTFDDIRQLQHDDPIIGSILCAVEEHTKPNPDASSGQVLVSDDFYNSGSSSKSRRAYCGDSFWVMMTPWKDTCS